MAMYDYGFETAVNVDIPVPDGYTVRLAGSENDTLSVSPESGSVTVTSMSEDLDSFGFEVVAPPFVYAPVKKGDETAQLRLTYKGREVRTIPLYADEDAEYASHAEKKSCPVNNIITKLRDFFNERNWR